MVGHVTRDEVDGGVRLGGAGSYAALAAACLGYETALVTVAPPDDPLLDPLRRVPRLQVHCVPSAVMTTFALDYADGHRRLWLPDRLVEIERDPEAITHASVRCDVCHARWSDGTPEFWLGVREAKAFPKWCPVCGCELPQWVTRAMDGTRARAAEPPRVRRPSRRS